MTVFGGIEGVDVHNVAGAPMVKRFVIAVVALIVVVGGLVGFNLFRDNMIAKIFANLPAQVVPVNTVIIAPMTWQPTIDTIGTANAAQGVDLTVESPGIVREIAFTPGTKVAKGDLLLRLDDATQAADVNAAQTQADLAKAALNRAQRLQKRGVAADASLENAQSAARSAEAGLARAKAALQTRRLVAPFGGTVGLARVDTGAYIAPGAVVVTLQDLDRMRVDFTLPEQELPHLSIGQPLTVTSDGRRFTGQITGIDPRVNAASRLVALRGEVENADGLIPGQFVEVAVALAEEKDILAVPQTALMSSLYGDYVYVVREKRDDQGAVVKDDEGTPRLEVKQVFVTPGRRSGVMVELVTDQVKAGDQIVIAGQNRLSSGALVKVDNSVMPPTGGLKPGTAPAHPEGAGANDGVSTEENGQ